MTFQSFEYAVLLLAVFAGYWFVPRRFQNLLLLVSSYVFYSYVDPKMALLLGSYTALNYIAARRIETDPNNARKYLWLAITAQLGALAFFKYTGFFVESISEVLDTVGLANFESTLKIILPVGISFYTFQSLGYVIDVYTKRTFARGSLIDTALFVSFFPQLVAGPIERASVLLPQFERRRRFDADRTASGISLIAWGLFKKLVIADNIGMIVDRIFSSAEPGGTLLWVGVLAFGVQILADFSGYTDIARGSARILGIELSVNFRHPWLATSPADFWRRWHITLSSWLRDYVYIPLGGNRNGRYSLATSLVITFVLGGLWHGAAWNFVLWGLLHSSLILISRAASQLKLNIPVIPATLITFIIISASWLLFREGDVAYIVDNTLDSTADLRFALGIGITTLIYSLPIWLHAIIDRPSISSIWTRNDVSRTVALTAFTLTSFLAILLLRADTSAEFIYFRF
ncbi:MAG: MBOAT family protein [Chloroflexi bacterium]|nr:MBOAT family protein [Chloroflexota bacterium]